MADLRSVLSSIEKKLEDPIEKKLDEPFYIRFREISKNLREIDSRTLRVVSSLKSSNNIIIDIRNLLKILDEDNMSNKEKLATTVADLKILADELLSNQQKQLYLNEEVINSTNALLKLVNLNY